MDPKIDELIRPPRKIYVGFDWSRTDRLRPTGDAERHKILSERLRPPTELKEDQ